MNEKNVIVSNTSWSLFNFRLELAKDPKRSEYVVVLIASYDEYKEIMAEEFEYHDTLLFIQISWYSKEDIKALIKFYMLYLDSFSIVKQGLKK